MVGDVKQSIYRFRQARPELFLDKYKKYQLVDRLNGNELNADSKILLYKNFRSRQEVIDFTNVIFQNIMSNELGEIDYGEEEYLNIGATFEEPRINNTQTQKMPLTNLTKKTKMTMTITTTIAITTVTIATTTTTITTISIIITLMIKMLI